MKRSLIVLGFLLITGLASAQNKNYKASEASKRIGESIVVIDTVKGYKVIREGFILLDLGARYPNQLMTVVLKGNKLRSDDIPANPAKLVGHAVRVEGNVILYNNKPEIVVTEKSQFKDLKTAGD